MDSGTTEPVTTETTEATSGGETEDETDALGNKYIYQNVDVNRKESALISSAKHRQSQYLFPTKQEPVESH